MKIIFYSFCFLIIGCNSENKVKVEQDVKQDTDTVRSKDSITSREEIPDPVNADELIKSWNHRYRDTITIDTVLKKGVDNIHITFRHYCLFDSSLIVPEVYVKLLGMKKFISNNFESSIRIETNDSLLVDTTIDKSVFSKTLINNNHYELFDYGALLFNDIKIGKNVCRINYLIEVPLSDVGQLFYVDVFFSGKLEPVDR
ncbi:hypothetical protein [Chitinophaga silvisoli]|uniref:DUF4738 domain-containing protein n=1 Tax=Chitinophaga silvisoli TaxID=2291814 RepID=A0A3E1NWN3_9BACT|nr:hypothetical protein [Chitinophaga silvisoli]RFM32347.1 hypothetical protein DXN04_21915 [Chitinophaga silvisoli]